MYIPNDVTQNGQFCRLKLVDETFRHSTLLTNQSKFNKSPQVVMLPNKKSYCKKKPNVASLLDVNYTYLL